MSAAPDPYLDDGHKVLRNLLGLTNPVQLDMFDRRIVTQRFAEGPPAGGFDLVHLRAIHHHLFQDLYDWAGAPRTIDLDGAGESTPHGNGPRFQKAARIEADISAIHRDLAAKDFLKGLAPGDFAREAALLIGDLSYVHPFRAGNGRTGLVYLKLLAEEAGHPLDLGRLPAEPWIEAAEAALAGDLEPSAALILFALT